MGAELLQSSPVFLNSRQIETETGHVLSAGKIVIATGSSPFIPEIKGLDKADFITNEDILNLKKLPGE